VNVTKETDLNANLPSNDGVGRVDDRRADDGVNGERKQAKSDGLRLN
jgi:hypothetical protein